MTDDVPVYIQRSVLYDLIWYFKYLINHDERIAFLSGEDKEKFENLLYEIFGYIDVDTIDTFNLAGNWHFFKVIFIEKYKQIDYHKPIYIVDYDFAKDEIKVRYFYIKPFEVTFSLNDKKSIPLYSKIRDHYFLDDTIIYEKIIWLPLSGKSLTIKAYADNEMLPISLGGKWHKNDIPIKSIKKYYRKPLALDKIPLKDIFYRILYTNKLLGRKYKNAWMLMDRDTQADDNAEHLYRYIVSYCPEINIFFVLRKTSHDWDRLSKERFNLIAFDSFAHKQLYANAIHLISSHADTYVIDYLPQKSYKDILKHKVTFLQHGVIQNNLSNWLNSKKIDCFITTALSEYNSISGDHNNYKFTKKEVLLSGQPRHDSLLRVNRKPESIITIIPTWREFLTGQKTGKGNDRALIKDFIHSEYYQKWNALLNSKILKELSEKYHFHIIFFPHVNMYPYLPLFKIPEYIETTAHLNGSIQELFQKTALMVTDYSSVAFELGLLQRGLIYYQFDQKEIYGDKHICQKGYFNYEKDGFGPVCYSEDDVLQSIEAFLQKNGELDEKYLKRMREFFAFRDTNNCKRVYETIKGMYE